MERVYNFSAAQAPLPATVLERVSGDFRSYAENGTVMPTRRLANAADLTESVRELLQSLMNIPDNYKVLLLQGGASSQFAAVPLNLMKKNRMADYIISGHFSEKAYREAQKYGDVAIAATSKAAGYAYIPKAAAKNFSHDADYVHICFNNTVYGTSFNYIPETANIPLVADMTSCILSEPADVSKFGVIYAGAQANIGCAGLTAVIVRDDLIGDCCPETPTMLDWSVMSEYGSLYNTPPYHALYIAKLVLEWVSSLGGLRKMREMNLRKAGLLYGYLDSQSYYKAYAKKEHRSQMNVTFMTGDAALDKKFVREAELDGLFGLGGAAAVGGMRASLYNAVSYESVKALVEFMDKFAKDNPKRK